MHDYKELTGNSVVDINMVSADCSNWSEDIMFNIISASKDGFSIDDMERRFNEFWNNPHDFNTVKKIINELDEIGADRLKNVYSINDNVQMLSARLDGFNGCFIPEQYHLFYSIYGQMLLAMGENSQAKKYLDYAYSFNPYASDVIIGVISYYVVIGDFPMVIEIANKGLRYMLDFDYISLLYQYIGKAALALFYDDLAKASFSLALSLAINSEEILSDIGSFIDDFEPLNQDEIKEILIKYNIRFGLNQEFIEVIKNKALDAYDNMENELARGYCEIILSVIEDEDCEKILNLLGGELNE